MQVTLEKTSDLEGLIKVSVVEADYADKVKKELREIGAKRQMPGFRPGHVPTEMLRKRFGREVKSHVLNEEVYQAVIDYIRQNKIDILGEPLPVDVKEINLDDKDYNFEYEVGLVPDFSVDLDKEVHIPYYLIDVTKEMVDEQDKNLRRRFGAQVPGETFEPDALVKGALMELDAEGNVRSDEGAIQVVDGIVAPMYFSDKAQAELFDGKKVGDKVRFNPAASCSSNAAELASMLHIDKERAATVTSDFEMAISEIIVVREAEHNEDFYKEVFHGDAVKTEQEYFDALREMIARQLRPNSDQMFDRDARDLIVEKFGHFALPVAFLKKWLLARNPSETPEKIDEDFPKMEPSIKWELIEGKIREKNDIKVNDDDMLNFAKQMAFSQFAQYGMTNLDDATLTNYAKHILDDKKTAAELYRRVADAKLFNVIRALVTPEEKTVSLDEFKRLANPQTAEQSEKAE